MRYQGETSGKRETEQRERNKEIACHVNVCLTDKGRLEAEKIQTEQSVFGCGGEMQGLEV